ncbi:MAG: PQQ-dependent sugar dehydrogenase, partial [Planctomycetales bacterium]|nr:PQQ-dependent sugar dehydrogenase [Planctomycetales bacterium]
SDGSLFVTNASAADRTLDEHPWGGTILRFPPDFSAPEIYARGFRNPWEIDLGPDDEVFVTDSDVDKNPGDEINHVQSGAHYGHPFVIPNEPGVHPEGFVDPVFVGERESVFLGMTYATSARLPEKFRNCIYVADFRQDRILRVVLGRAGETYKAEDVQPFAFVPSPIDIVATGDGEFFVISRRAKQLYRIR